MLYRRVELCEGRPVQFVGVHALRWGKADKPTIGFVEAEQETEVVKEAVRIVVAFTQLKAVFPDFLKAVERLEEETDFFQN